MADDSKSRAWMIAIGTMLGGLAGIVAVITFVRDYNNPIGRAILASSERHRQNDETIAATATEAELAERNAWNEALRLNTPAAYAAYMNTFPSGHFVADAARRMRASGDQLAWNVVLAEGTAEAARVYLAAYPGGTHGGEANRLIRRLEQEAGGHFNLAILRPDVAARVRSARDISLVAQVASRRGRAGQHGYISTSRGGVTMLWPGSFEGRGSVSRSWAGTFYTPELGVWALPQNPEIASLAGVVTRQPGAFTGYRLLGTIRYRDGRVYEGEIYGVGPNQLVQSPDDRSNLINQPEGVGAMWADDGSLIGAGQWASGTLQ